MGQEATFRPRRKSGMVRRMRGTTIWFYGLVSLLLASCGGSKPPAEEPGNTVESPTDTPPSEEAKPDEPKETDEKPAEKPGANVAEPEFKDGGSVDEAIKAVPQGTPRLNIETEALSKPLM